MSSDSQSAANSRLPLSNRADGPDAPLRAPNTRLAKADGTELREELVFDTISGVKAVPWEVGVERFDGWYDDSRGGKIVVENEQGERTGFNTPNRFTPDYREMLYAKAQSLERGLRDQWGKALHTAMLTLTCSTTDDDGNLRPPVEHLDELLSSWEAVRRELSRTLDGREWEYLAILEPHTEHSAGYAHVHLGVFVKGPVVPEQFRSVLDAHLRNCEGAGEKAHRVFDQDGDEDSVTVRRAGHPSREGVENLGAYLAAYMAGEYGKEATEMPEYIRGFYTVMWATGRQWFRPSNGAQELMQPEEESESEVEEVLGETWEVVGLAPDGDIEEVVEFDPDEKHGSPYRRIRDEEQPPPDVDPPDHWGSLTQDKGRGRRGVPSGHAHDT